MSQLLKNYVPNQFKIFRNGGEEFSVVIRNYSLDQSVKLAENIRSGVEVFFPSSIRKLSNFPFQSGSDT